MADKPEHEDIEDFSVTSLITIMIGVIIISIIGLALSGYALSILWEWFIVPIFNVPSLSAPIAIGIMLIVNYVIYHHIEYKDYATLKEEVQNIIVASVVKPIGAIIVGWVITLFL